MESESFTLILLRHSDVCFRLSDYTQLRKELDQQQIMVSKFIGNVIFVILFRQISDSID